METNKKAAVIFLAVVNLMNIAAGIITQIKISFNRNIVSILPIKSDLTDNQILMVNFIAVFAAIFLVCTVSVNLFTDIHYTLPEIMSNVSLFFMIIPAAVAVWGIFNGVRAQLSADKIWIIASSVIYLLFSIFDIACALTVLYDAED